MKQFDLQGNEYDIQIRDMIEPIENWQYVSGTRDIGKSYFQNLLNEKDEEIERLKEDNEYLNKVNIELSTEKNRLNNIINEAINYTTKQMKKYEGYDRDFEIVLSNIVVMLGSE